jgi:hypothetical protein
MELERYHLLGTKVCAVYTGISLINFRDGSTRTANLIGIVPGGGLSRGSEAAGADSRYDWRPAHWPRPSAVEAGARDCG